MSPPRSRPPPIIIGGTMGGESETIECFSRRETIVFWNLDDYPVPNNTDVRPIKSAIKVALEVMGFPGGPPEINLHCEKLKYDLDALFDTGKVVYLPEGTQAYKDQLGVVDMTYYILMHVEYAGREHCNVAVISKKPNDELLRVLGCLKSRGHTSLLIEPPSDDEEECVFSVKSLVTNAQLLGGGRPIHKHVVTTEDLAGNLYDIFGPKYFRNEEEDYNSRSTPEMIDFSERAKHVKGERTVVFWDALDCPFPLCFSSSPDVIFKKISKALFKRGFSRKVSIWAYVEKDSELLVRKKTWPSKIYFLPGDNNASSRRIRMLNDILLLSRDSPPRYHHEASLILVSGQFKGDRPYMSVLRIMETRHYYLVLVPPRKQAEGPDVWPALLLDRGYTIC